MAPVEDVQTTHDGLKLKTYTWKSSEPEVKGVLVLLHGLFEHCQRYEHVANFFNQQGFHVYGYDQRGHGLSEGLKGYVEDFSDFTQDLHKFLQNTEAKNPGLPLFLVVHSFGAAVSARYLIETPTNNVTGYIVSAGAFAPGSDINALKIAAARLFSRWFPKLPIEKLKSGSTSRDPKVVEEYDNDPLVYRGAMRARLGFESLETFDVITERGSTLSLPILLMHGDADTMTDPEGTKTLYKKASSTDKTLKIYPGLYHELFNEPEKEDIMNDVLHWIQERI